MKRTTYRPLTTDELAELKAFAAAHGRTWKDTLRGHWYNASYPGLLHALRNSHGPSWLNNFKLPQGVLADFPPSAQRAFNNRHED